MAFRRVADHFQCLPSIQCCFQRCVAVFKHVQDDFVIDFQVIDNQNSLS